MTHLGSSSLGRRLVVSAAAVNLFVVGLAAASLQLSRAHFREQAAASGQSLARLLETAITASFDQIDLALQAVADEHRREARLGAIDPDAFGAFLSRQKERAPLVLSLRTTDAQGMTSHSAPALSAPVSLADREFFAPLRANPGAGLFVARPYMGRVVSTPVMVFARRLEHGDGSFAGVVTGAVPLVHLGQLLSLADVGPQGIVTVRWSDDLSLVAARSATAVRVELGDRKVTPQLRRLAEAGVASAWYQAPSALDGVDRTFSVRRVARYPLYVVVGLAEKDFLAEWRRAAVRTALLVACFASMTVVLAAFVHRAWRRRLADERLLLERSERLRESEEQFRVAFLTSRDSITLSRLTDWSLIAVNEAFVRMTGRAEAEVMGRSPGELGIWVDPADRQRLMDGLRRDGFVDNLETRFAGKDGMFTGLVSARVIQVGGERLVLATTRDISAWKRAEEERDRLREQMQRTQKLESLGQLAGGVAHDFNNLLTVILSCADEARADVEAGKLPGVDGLEEILSAGARASDLTRRLLAVARRQVIAPVCLDLAEAIRSGERLLRRVLPEDIALHVDVADGLWPVWCDPGQIEQVLLNLVVNARDAMCGGGTIRIDLANVAVGCEEATPERPAGEWVALRVLDDGAGMTPEVKARLFEPFFTTKQAGVGTGLGLAIVHGIVTQSGGHIHATSEPGAGTCFEILLPRTDRVSAAPRPASAISRPGSETILVVEDDPHVREVTARALREAGYRIVVAAGGAEALALVDGRTSGIDLLVTDVVMPGMGGKAVADELLRRIPGIQVLFVSGYARDTSLEVVGRDGRRHFLAKPFTAPVLLERVRQVLDGSRA